MRLPYGLLLVVLRSVAAGEGPATASAQTPVTFAQAMTMVQERNERWRAADQIGRAHV